MLIWAPSDAVPPGLRVLSGTEAGPRFDAKQQGLRRCCQEWWLSAVAWLLQAHAVAACAPEQQPPAQVHTAVTIRGQATTVVTRKELRNVPCFVAACVMPNTQAVFCNVMRSMGPEKQ